MSFTTSKLRVDFNYLAPDGSEIRLLTSLKDGGLCHCTLPAGKVSSPVKHKTVEEIWYFLSGSGEVWRKDDDMEETVSIGPGICVTIPLHTSFQFRNTGTDDLKFMIVTMPPWPENTVETIDVTGKW